MSAARASYTGVVHPVAAAHPSLAVIAGPLRGATIPLDRPEFCIGRDAASDLRLDDPAVSRRHCILQIAEGRCTLKDLESRNGTFVNRVPVRERALDNCDEVRIGDSVFLFVLAGYEAPPVAAPRPPDYATRTVVLRPENSIYMGGGPPSGAVAANDLKSLLTFSQIISATRDLGSFRTAALDWFKQHIPADELELVTVSGAGELLTTLPIVEHAIDAKAAVLLGDSAAAIPLIARGEARGAVYIGRSKPFSDREFQLAAAAGAVASMALENLGYIQDLERENERLREEIRVEHNMVGESTRMRHVFERINKAAPSEATVLIRGESGTGKELVARAIHSNSSRAPRPFIPINCATLTETLLESELFGHEKGAFTGAIAQKRGKIEFADGGTLFLDEIGEMSPALQAKLLRVLQEREFERVGGSKALKINIRVIAATHRDLEAAVKSGAFRSDLYYRLNVVTIQLPALRERRDDIPLLASYFVTKYAASAGRPIRGISTKARACLMHHDWPGNVRELENAIERAVVLGNSDSILAEDLPESVLESGRAPSGESNGYHEQVSESKKKIILTALDQAGGSQVEAAKLLGLHPTYLNRLMRNFNLRDG